MRRESLFSTSKTARKFSVFAHAQSGRKVSFLSPFLNLYIFIYFFSMND